MMMRSSMQLLLPLTSGGLGLDDKEVVVQVDGLVTLSRVLTLSACSRELNFQSNASFGMN